MQWFFAANAQAELRGLTGFRTAAVSSSLWLCGARLVIFQFIFVVRRIIILSDVVKPKSNQAKLG
jgi:hypothetical protein